MKKLLSVVTLLIIIGAGMTSLVYAQYPNPNTNENRMEYVMYNTLRDNL